MKIADLEMYQNIQVFNKLEKKYYFVYCRKSSESEDRQTQSIEDQLNSAQNVISTRNLEVAETFTESQSAKMPGRPEFNRMVEEIYKRHDIKGIICWKLNRLARNPKDEGTLRWLLQGGELEEIITPERVYTDVDSDFVMAIEGSQAQRFITDLKKDTKRGLDSKLAKGIPPILAPPGYRNAVEKRQGEKDIQPHPKYFLLMRKVFALALTGNYSVMQLWKKVDELGIKNSRNQIVSRSQLYKCLRDPFYTGTRFIYANKLYTNGIHKQMITDEEFDLLQDILTSRSHPRGQVHEDLLTGLIRCGECDSGITTEVQKKKLKNGKVNEHIYYRCTKKRRDTRCSQPYIAADKLERQINEYIDGLRLSSAYIEWAVKWLGVMNERNKKLRNAKLDGYHQEYKDVIKKIDKVKELAIANFFSSTDEAKKEKQLLEQEAKRLFAVISKIDTHVTEWTNLTFSTLDFIRTVKEKFNNGTIEQRKTILRVIGSNLVLKDKQLAIELRTPFAYIKKVAEELQDDKHRLEPQTAILEQAKPLFAFEKTQSG